MGNEKLDRIKENNQIIDCAVEMGFHLKKVGKWFTLSEHDSIRIDPNRNIYMQNSTGRGGSVIDFVSEMENISTIEAIKRLSNRTDIKGLNQVSTVKKEKIAYVKKEFKLPQKDSNEKNVYSYLTKTRGISGDLVNKFIKKGLLYQDIKKNCVFVSYKDKKPVFASQRGTNTYKKFVADVSGNDYKHCFFIDNKAHKLVVTESAIDLMSKMDYMKSKGLDLNEYNFLSISGTEKIEKALTHHLNINQYNYVNLSLDNDKAGKLATEVGKNFIENIEEEKRPEVEVDLPEFGKDWNDNLKYIKSNENSLENETQIAINKKEKDKDFEI